MSAPNDPDLMQTVEDLRYDVARIRQLQQHVVDATIDTAKYSQLLAARQELSDLRERVRVRAERLNLPADALMMIVEQAERLRTRARGKVSEIELKKAVTAAAHHASSAAVEAEAESRLRLHEAAFAARKTQAAQAALTYMGASA